MDLETYEEATNLFYSSIAWNEILVFTDKQNDPNNINGPELPKRLAEFLATFTDSASKTVKIDLAIVVLDAITKKTEEKIEEIAKQFEKL